MPLNAAILLLLACLLAAPSSALAQIARVLDTKGANMVERAGKPPRILGQGEQLDEKDVISVARDSYAVLEFRDQTRITLRPNTIFRLDTYRDKESESMLFGLVKGGFRAVTGLVGKTNPKAVNFNTATATIGIRGTEFDARLCEDDCATEERRSAQPAFPVAARLVDLKGSVMAVNVGGIPRKLVPGSYVRQFDEVRTAKSSYAVLLLRDGGRLVVHPDTRIVFQRFRYEPSRPADAEVDLMLLAGRIGTQTGSIGKARPVGYRIATPFGRIDTRGTATDVTCTGSCAESGQSSSSAAGGEQALSAQVQILVAYAQQSGMSPTDVAQLQSLAGGGASYAQLQQALLAQDPVKWWPLLTALAGASNVQALTTALYSPPAMPTVEEWGTQAVSAQAAEGLKGYAQAVGLPAAAQALLSAALSANPAPSYAELQQMMQENNALLWGPLLAVFENKGNAESFTVAITSPPPSAPVTAWGTQKIPLSAMSALVGDLRWNGVQISYGLTYLQLQQQLQAICPPTSTACGSLKAALAGSGSAEAFLMTTLASPSSDIASWGSPTIAPEAQQLLVTYAQQSGMSPTDVAQLQSLAGGGASYVQLQQALLAQDPVKWWPLLTAFAGAGSLSMAPIRIAGVTSTTVDSLIQALYSPPAMPTVEEWGTQAVSAQAAEGLKGYAQAVGLPAAAQALLSAALSANPAPSYAELQQMMQENNALLWGPLLAVFENKGNAESFTVAITSPPPSAPVTAWGTQTMPAGIKNYLQEFWRSQGVNVSYYGSATYLEVQQMLQYQCPVKCASILAAFASAGSAEAFLSTVSSQTDLATYIAWRNSGVVLWGTYPPAYDAAWREQAIAAEAQQLLVTYAQQSGMSPTDVAQLQSLAGGGASYAQLQQALLAQDPVKWWPLLTALAGASNVQALTTALYSPPAMPTVEEWGTQAVSAQAAEGLKGYAQAVGLPAAAQALLSAALSANPAPSYAELQQMMQENNALLWGPLLAVFENKGNAESFTVAITSPPPSAPVTAWGTQTMPAGIKNYLQEFWRSQGVNVSYYGSATYLEVQQMLQYQCPVKCASILAAFASAGSAEAFLSTVSSQTDLATYIAWRNSGVVLWGTYPPAYDAAWREQAIAAEAQQASAPDSEQGMQVSVSEGAVDVGTLSGTQTVNAGQTVSMGRSNSPLLFTGSKPNPIGVPNFQMPGIDSGRMFGDEAPAAPERGLYVWVRDGAVQLAKGGDAVDVPAGGAAVATSDRVVLLDVVPNFMRFDSTPRPLPAGGERVADAFVAADGSQSSMCVVR